MKHRASSHLKISLFILKLAPLKSSIRVDDVKIRKNLFLNPLGILRLSTLGTLVSALSSCNVNEKSHVVTEEEVKMVEKKVELDELEKNRTLLQQGIVPHDFYIKKIGYYHATVEEFYPIRYGTEQNEKFFINGEWLDSYSPNRIPSSAPSADTLVRIEKALEEEQKESSTHATTSHSPHGSGMGSWLMMYWLLSGNQGRYSSGSGYQQASSSAPAWQQSMNQQRNTVQQYSANHPNYQRLVEERKKNGSPLTTGGIIKGGFGSSSKVFSSSSRS
jgi:hypothetical protein